ncbi:MAG: TonB-dependent receptor [Candidatus Aminicenantes bacterium]|nr:TonB-dependent receptor [Candidatus Aminicenantes bacterium]
MFRKLFVFVLFFFLLSEAMMMLAFQEEKESRKQEKKEREEALSRPHREITVTATMSRKEVRDCSASVSVVKEEDIRSISSSNAFNLLEGLPGIFIQRTGDFGRSDVDIRGLGQRGRRIAVLVDGRPEKMGLYGCAVSHAFPLDNVERIEVVRGPSSVLYGSDALGGVINILTRIPEKKFETDFRASYGSFNTLQLNLRHGGNVDKFSYYFTLDKRKSDGHRPSSSYNGNAFTGKIIYDTKKNIQISLRGKYFDGKKYEAGPVDTPLMDFWNDYERGAVDFTVQSDGSKENFLVKAYRNFGHHLFSDGWHSRDYINGGLLRITSRRLQYNELTLGFDFRFIGGKSYGFPKGEWTKNEVSVFLQDEWVVKNRWIFSGGLRLQRDSLYGYEICPHGGIVFLWNETTSIRGLVNKGFRSPQLNELYMFPSSNQNLNPERVWNVEVGFTKTIFDSVALNASVYRMYGSNLIETVSNPSPPPLALFMNAGEFTFTGIEAGLDAEFSRHLTAHFYATFLNPGERTKGRAGRKLDLFLRYRKGIFDYSIQARYVADYYAADFSEKPLPSYFLLNSRLRLGISEMVEIFIDLNNILNSEYQVYVDLPGIAAGAYPMPGRNIQVGFSLSQ